MSKTVKTVSTISKARKGLFAKSKEVLGNFKDACAKHLTAVGDIRAHFEKLGKEGGFDFRDVIIGDTRQAIKNNEALGDPEVIAHFVPVAMNVREIHAQSTFAGYSADQIKEKGGAEKALEKARKAAKTWYVEAIKGTKRNTKNSGSSKPQSKGKGKKNGKVTDLVEVADQQALNYVNAITALIDSAPESTNADSLREIRELIAGYHALDI